MRLSSIAIAVACIAAAFSTAEAAPAKCTKSYKVVSGDTCSKIATKYGISVSKLTSLNTQINSKCSNLQIGESLCVSTASSSSSKTTTKKTTTKKTTTKKTTTKKTTTKKSTTKKTTTKKTTTKKTTTKKTTTKKTTTTKTTATRTTTATGTTATATPNVANYGLTVQITSSKDFCLMLPNSPGNKADNNGKVDVDAIARSEKDAVAFCLKPNVNAPGARTLPVTFVETAHFYRNDTAGYVQVTGKFNPQAYELSTKDEGGQYDNHGAGSPPNSICYGYRYYVSLIEPSNPDYCIRCCHTYEDCHAGRSTYGCRRVVSNGNYN